jgi:hypothetical protein
MQGPSEIKFFNWLSIGSHLHKILPFTNRLCLILLITIGLLQSCTDDFKSESASDDRNTDEPCSTNHLKGFHVDEAGNFLANGIRRDNSFLDFISGNTHFLLNEKYGELLLNFGDYRKGTSHNLCNKVFYQLEFLAHKPNSFNSIEWVTSDEYRIPVLENLLKYKKKSIDILQEGNNYFIEPLGIRDTSRMYPRVAVLSKNGRYVTGTIYLDASNFKRYVHSFHYGEITGDALDLSNVFYAADTSKVEQSGTFRFEQFGDFLVSRTSGIYFIKCDSFYLRRYCNGIQAFEECNQNMFINGFDHAYPRMNLTNSDFTSDKYLFSGLYNIPSLPESEPSAFSTDKYPLGGTYNNSSGGGKGGTGWVVSIGGSIENRDVIKRGRVEGQLTGEGNVVIFVCVDSDGNVIEARRQATGSTTLDATLISKAAKAAKEFKFESSDQDRGCGTITFYFRYGANSN